LRGAILTNAERPNPPLGLVLRDADVTGAILDYADFDTLFPAGYDASCTVFVDCSMCHANMNRMDLTQADLSGADLTEATTDEAVMCGTILNDTRIPMEVARGAVLTDHENRILPEGMPLSQQDLQNCGFDYADAVGRDFSKADLTNATFTRADLTGASFEGATLCHVDFTNAIMQDVNLKGADLRGANFTQAVLCIADLPPDERPEGWDLLTKAEQRGHVLTGAILTNAEHTAPPIGLSYIDRNLTGALLGHGNFRGYAFVRTILKQCTLFHGDFTGADFLDADLTTADVRGASMARCNLDGTILKGIELTDGANPQPPITITGRNLNDCSLRGADLRGADMRKANLRRAKMYRADFRRADLRGADLSYAFFSDARGCEEAVWGDDCLLKGASVPEGFEKVMLQLWGERGWTPKW